MGRSLVSVLCLVLLAGQSCAHFVLHSPPTVGFNDDNEGKAPCGGFNPPFKDPSDFHVGGDAIALTTTHPTANWLFRASLDTDAAGGFTDLLPAVSQTSLGDFCEPDITVPSSWAGKSGVLQIVQDAADGILYQVMPPQRCPSTIAFLTSIVNIVCLCPIRQWQGVVSSSFLQERDRREGRLHYRCEAVVCAAHGHFCSFFWFVWLVCVRFCCITFGDEQIWCRLGALYKGAVLVGRGGPGRGGYLSLKVYSES